METTRLIDPAFWRSREVAFPGVDRPEWAGRSPGLVWFRTSGSTGEPRWIGHTRDGLLLSAAVVNRHLAVEGSDVWGLALPLRHVGGFGVAARAFESGAEIQEFSGSWNPRAFGAWLEERRVNHLSLVPTQIHDLVQAGLRAPDTLRTLVVGGGALDEQAGVDARDLGWPVLPSYGLTEAASQVATASPELLEGPYSGGVLPVLPHWEVRCDDDERIFIRGLSLFVAEGFESGAGVEIVARRDDWFETGDFGRLGEGGLQVLGRADLLVKVLGELVDPVSIERKLGLQGAAVVPVPDERRQHRLILVVEDGQAEAVEVVRSYNDGAVGPERVEGPIRVPAFPRSALGKLRRAELLEQVRRLFP